MGDKPAGGSDDDVGAARDGFFALRKILAAAAAIHGNRRHAGEIGIGFYGLVNLRRQFAGRHDDKGLREVGFARCHDFMDDGQHKGGSFAGAGLGDANEVFALQNQRDGLLLDGCGGGEIECVNAVQQVGV